MATHHPKHHHEPEHGKPHNVRGEEHETKEIKPADAVIYWEAPEYEYKEKSVAWYWMSLFAAIALIVIALWAKNFLFAIFVVITELVLLYFSNRFPKVWSFRIDGKGLHIGDSKVFPFEQIKAFDIHEFDDEYKELVLRVTSKITPHVKIFVFHDDIKAIEERIGKFCQKEEIPVSLVDSLERFFNF